MNNTDNTNNTKDNTKDNSKGKKKKYFSDIAAKIHISESEIVLVNSEYTYDDFLNNPQKYNDLFFSLGMDMNYSFVYMPIHLHRNRLNKVVICGRFYGDERTDKEWISSGHASQAAKDKASNCRLIDEMYQVKGLTQTAQVAGELKDSYTKESEED